MKELYQFATVRELEYLEAIEKHGSGRKAADALGVAKTTVHEAIQRLKKRAAKSLPSLHDYTKQVPDGYAIRGVSQFVNSEGKVSGQWIKSSIDDKAQQEALKAADLRRGVDGLRVFPSLQAYQY